MQKAMIGPFASAIRAAIGTKYDVMNCNCVSKLSKAIDISERFVLDDLTTQACHKVANSKPTSTVAAIPLMRVPFSNVWIEWRPDALNGMRSIDPNGNGVKVPVWMGAQLEVLDGSMRQMGMTFAWAILTNTEEERALMGKYGINICPLGVIANWDTRWQVVAPKKFVLGENGIAQQILNNPSLSSLRKFLNDEKEMSALITLEEMMVQTIPPIMQETVEMFRNTFPIAAMRRMFQSAKDDLIGEPWKIAALLCMINSRNCVEIVAPSRGWAKKHETNRTKARSVSYSVVKIALTRAEKHYAERNKLTDIEIRRHIVRGHFKVRKSGIFWWRPFFRGSEENGEVHRSGYAVVGNPPAQTQGAS